MRRMTVLGFLAIMLGVARPATADLVVTFSEPTIPANQGTADVDVYVRSTNGSDSVGGFDLTFQITQAGATQTQLAFDPNQPPVTPSTSLFGSDSYAYQGNGGSSPQPLGSPSTTNYPNDTLYAVDSTADSTNVPILTTPTLLAVLQLTTQTPFPPGPGDTFSINLIPTGSSSSPGNDQSTFYTYDSSGNPVYNESYQSTPGTITITAQTTAVPEPATLHAVLTGTLLCGAVYAWRRWKTRRALA